MRSVPNLSRRPFVNEGPVLRLAGALWLVALVLVGVDVWLYARHFTGSRATRRQQQQVREQTAEQVGRLRDVRRELEALDLEWQNRQAAFVNRRIAERAFSWSELFDRIEEVLPGEVRLTSLAPNFRTRERENDPDAPILLRLRGQARDDGSLLAFLDRLFEHQAFASPHLEQETSQEGLVGFSLQVLYRAPQAKPAPRARKKRAKSREAAAAEPAPEAPAETAPPGEGPRRPAPAGTKAKGETR